MHYAVACWEAMAGNADAAIAALSTAFELDPKSAEWAKNDTDLDAIRGLPGSPVTASFTSRTGSHAVPAPG